MRTTATPGSLRGPPVVLWAAACLVAAGSTTRRPVSAQPPPPELVGEMRLFSTSACPPGWEEVNATKGFVLTGRPEGVENATNGAPALGPMERGRVGPHAHAVPQHDVTIHDPGHGHGPGSKWRHGKGSWASIPTDKKKNDPGAWAEVTDQHHETGVTATDPATATTTNQVGSDYLPLAYVLVCQRLADSPRNNAHHLRGSIPVQAGMEPEELHALINDLKTSEQRDRARIAELEARDKAREEQVTSLLSRLESQAERSTTSVLAGACSPTAGSCPAWSQQGGGTSHVSEGFAASTGNRAVVLNVTVGNVESDRSVVVGDGVVYVGYVSAFLFPGSCCM